MDSESEINLDLLTLVNMLLHSSYQFFFLSSISRKLNLTGFAWATMLKENKCKDSALVLLDWINNHEGTLQLAEVAEPRFVPSDLSPEFVVTRWDEVEKWLKIKIDNIRDKVLGSDIQDKLLTIQMLDLIMDNILSYS